MSSELENRITALAEGIAIDVRFSLRNKSNIEEFQDGTFIYFVFEISTGGFQVNRYENSITRTVSNVTVRPVTLLEVQTLNYN